MCIARCSGAPTARRSSALAVLAGLCLLFSVPATPAAADQPLPGDPAQPAPVQPKPKGDPLPLPPPAPALPPPRPLTPDEIKAERDFALKLEADLNNAKSDLLLQSFNVEALQARAYAGLVITDKQRAASLNQLKTGAIPEMAAGFAKFVREANCRFKLIGIRSVNGDRRAVYRLMAPNGNFSYIEWTLQPTPAKGWEIVDAYTYSSGMRLSVSLRFGYLLEPVAETPALQKDLPAFEAAVVAAAPELKLLVRGNAPEDPATLAPAFARLPKNLRENHDILVVWMCLAPLSDAQAAAAALAAFQRLFPDDPAGDLAALASASAAQKYDQALAALDHVNKQLGPDAATDMLRARLMILKNDYKQARTFIERAAKTEPALESLYPLLFSITLHDEDFKTTLKYMTQFETATGKKLGNIDDNPVFEDFIGTEEYDQWQAKHKK